VKGKAENGEGETVKKGLVARVNVVILASDTMASRANQRCKSSCEGFKTVWHQQGDKLKGRSGCHFLTDFGDLCRTLKRVVVNTQ
jgi:hypothetical protein